MNRNFWWIVSLLLVLFNFSLVYPNSNVVTSAKEFTEMLVIGDYETAFQKFDPTMKNALPVNKLAETWNAVISQSGNFKRQISIRQETNQPYMIVIVTSEFEKAVLDIKVVFNIKNEIAGLFFAPGQLPQEHKDKALLPQNVTEKELSINNQSWTLPATLTLPSTEGLYPVVILVHGSGPNDRDETIGPNKPFRDLAWGLAKKGIAVLRYEKRTKVYGGLAFKNKVTVQEEVIDDVLAAISLLNTVPEINKNEIFVLGHSLGGMLAPRIALQAPNINGYIIMAGACRPLEDLISEQCTYIFSLDDNNSDEEKDNLNLLKKQIEKVKSPDLSLSTPATELPLNMPASYWLDLRGYNPTLVAQKIKKPFLILQGDRDYQVTIVDYQMWQGALSNRKDVEFKLYSGLNHLFIHGEGNPNPNEYQVSGHLAETVIIDIALWIKKLNK